MNQFILFNNSSDSLKRKKTGIYIGCIGILINFSIFLLEFYSGLTVNSTSLTADSFHNLVDSIFSIVTVFSFVIAGKPSDTAHPFGFGRTEYLCSFCLGILLLTIGIFFGYASIQKILTPSIVQFHISAFIAMIFSLILKLAYSILSRNYARKIISSALKATYWDAFTDVLTLSAALLSLIIMRFTGIHADGLLGTLISAVILYSGYSTIKQAADTLIGKTPDPIIADSILTAVKKGPNILGCHNLIIHDYGPGKIVASIHAEVPSDISFSSAHISIENIEQALRQKGIELTIHPDPVA
ncbi:cation diffusion facilitator family transporter [Pectinatus sottacetonis]|uniref:cation diffusion facilitator family transporter n=1 Tax=Pectinatus sottacetonis TaxID=1002795 RepID=UPI0018C4CCAF|nr:cation diffusion facilitator family transporter [Pectinatus sottacetonis]